MGRHTVSLAREEKGRQNQTNLGHGGGKDDDLIQLADPPHKLVDARPLDDIDVVISSFNFHWNCKVCLIQQLFEKKKEKKKRKTARSVCKECSQREGGDR